MSYLIKDTTREEREKNVADSLGYIEANCDGCMTGLVEMLMYGKEASNRKQEVDRQHHTIPKQKPNDRIVESLFPCIF